MTMVSHTTNVWSRAEEAALAGAGVQRVTIIGGTDDQYFRPDRWGGLDMSGAPSQDPSPEGVSMEGKASAPAGSWVGLWSEDTPQGASVLNYKFIQDRASLWKRTSP